MERLKHHTEVSGEIDRGKAASPFEAISFNNRKGEYLRTRHADEAAALARLRGNARHSHRHMVDHTERKADNGALLSPRVVHLGGLASCR